MGKTTAKTTGVIAGNIEPNEDDKRAGLLDQYGGQQFVVNRDGTVAVLTPYGQTAVPGIRAMFVTEE